MDCSKIEQLNTEYSKKVASVSRKEKSGKKMSLVFSKIPFEFEKMPTDEEMVRDNLFGNNIGNMYFFNAVVKSLRCCDHEIIRYEDGMNIDDYDSALLIQANQIRNGTEEWYKNDYELLKKCHIPFVIVCVGSDSTPDFKMKLNDKEVEIMRKFYLEILSRTSSIGVRGEWTKKVMVEQLGLPEHQIDVIGCPSIRYFGNKMKLFPRNYPKFSKDIKIAVNFTAYHYDEDEAIFLNKLFKTYKNSYVIFTDKIEAEMLWKTQEPPIYRRHDLVPTVSNHFMVRQGRCRFVPVQENAMKMLETFDFSIGSRIHQAIISILSGCPALLIAHSARVLEIAEHNHIPYIMRSELIEEKPSIETLYYRACTGMIEFYKSYNSQLKEYTNFLEKNNLVVNPDFLM